MDLPDRKPRLMIVPGGRIDLEEAPRQQAEIACQTMPDPHIRIRIQPTVYDPKQLYQAWTGVSWVMEFRDMRQLTEFRESLDQWIRGWIQEKRALPEEGQPA